MQETEQYRTVAPPVSLYMTSWMSLSWGIRVSKHRPRDRAAVCVDAWHTIPRIWLTWTFIIVMCPFCDVSERKCGMWRCKILINSSGAAISHVRLKFAASVFQRCQKFDTFSNISLSTPPTCGRTASNQKRHYKSKMGSEKKITINSTSKPCCSQWYSVKPIIEWRMVTLLCLPGQSKVVTPIWLQRVWL